MAQDLSYDRDIDLFDTANRASEAWLQEWLNQSEPGDRTGFGTPKIETDNGGFAMKQAAFSPPAKPAVQQPDSDDTTTGAMANAAADEYNVEVVFQGDWPETLREGFVNAANFLSTIITGDLPDMGDVDDLRITAELQAIDGQNGTLAYAGPTATRSDGLSYQGQMVFDSADADNLSAAGNFDDVVLHEMMHCVGIGTLWDRLNLTEGSPGAGDMRFTGENATLAYQTLYPDIAGNDPDADRGVPLETGGGGGTAGAHWDEDIFGNELMTGYVDSSNVFSGMTVAALEDMGYDTIFDAADPGADVPQLDDLMLVA